MIFRGDHEKRIYRGELLKKVGAWTVCRFKWGAWQRTGGSVFWGGGCWYPNAHYGKLKREYHIYRGQYRVAIFQEYFVSCRLYHFNNKRIQNFDKHLRWSFCKFMLRLKALNHFLRKLHLRSFQGSECVSRLILLTRFKSI